MSPRLRPFSHSLPMALLRAREAVMTRFRPLLREHGITEQQWRVLRALESVEEVTASELGRRTCLKPPSLSRILRSLERRRMVSRRAKRTDLRTSLVSICVRGQELLASVGPASEARYAEIGRQIGPHVLDQLYLLLDRLNRCLAEAAGPAEGRRPAPRALRPGATAATDPRSPTHGRWHSRRGRRREPSPSKTR